MKSDIPEEAIDLGGAGLLPAITESGVCRLICIDPPHNVTLATVEASAARRVVNVWAAQEAELAARADISYVQTFGNRGAMMGASNPHLHGQSWGTEHISNQPRLELAPQKPHLAENKTTLLMDCLTIELAAGERLVAENASWVALVAFWAVWPIELLLLPRAHLATLRELNGSQRHDLASILQILAAGYNRLFDTEFP